MRRKLIYLATCRELPEPDPDQELLISALAAQGLEARMLAFARAIRERAAGTR